MLSQDKDRYKIAKTTNLSIHSVNAYLYKAKKILGCTNTKDLLKISEQDIKEELCKQENSLSHQNKSGSDRKQLRIY